MEQTFLTSLARKAETIRQLGEDSLLEWVATAAEGANVADIRVRALRIQRQLVTDVGELVNQLRMAAAEGADIASQAWSPVADYEDLPEDVAKSFKDLKKEQEKAEKAKTQQGQRGGGGPYRGYGRGRGYYYQPYIVPQQPNLMSQPPPVQQQQIWPGQQVTQQGQYAYPIQQQYQYHPDGYTNRGRGSFRPDGRPVAKCYGCGVIGHFNKDNVCLPGAREAYQALQAGMFQRQGGPQLAIQGPPGTGGN